MIMIIMIIYESKNIIKAIIKDNNAIILDICFFIILKLYASFKNIKPSNI